MFTDKNKLITILNTSNLLTRLLPYVRKITLVETLKSADNLEQAYHIFLENLSSSPYLPTEDKHNIADLVLRKELDSLSILLKCNDNCPNQVIGRPIQTFREMMLTLFSKSKKIIKIGEVRKKRIASVILNGNSIDTLKELTINLLETSIALNHEERNLIANSIFDNRYDLLLLPNYLDCEEKNRLDFSIEELECPICLGSNNVNCLLPCQHKFCRSCIENWHRINQNCPICRLNFRLDEISYD